MMSYQFTILWKNHTRFVGAKTYDGKHFTKLIGFPPSKKFPRPQTPRVSNCPTLRAFKRGCLTCFWGDRIYSQMAVNFFGQRHFHTHNLQYTYTTTTRFLTVISLRYFFQRVWGGKLTHGEAATKATWHSDSWLPSWLMLMLPFGV